MLTTCPVRELTVEARALVALFRVCYRLRGSDGFSAPRWERIALPNPGGAADQEARTMQALDMIELSANAGLVQQQRGTSGRRRPRRQGRR